MDATTIGKVIFGAGGLLMLFGAGVWLLGRAGIPFGQLPGDLRLEGERSSFYFPVVTCIVLSVVLTIVINVVLRLFR